MERANKASVQTLENGFEARFFRTHKQVGTVESKNTAWVADPKHNKTLQREMFRTWVCENAGLFGLEWQPDDQRATENRRVPKYDSDATLLEDTASFLRPDVEGFVLDLKIAGLELLGIEAEDISPLAKSGKGADLSKLGILEGKYGNGNWAWAEISVVVTVGIPKAEEGQYDQGYVSLTCQLVSGQLKKPTSIDGAGYTLAGFRTAVLKDLGDVISPKTETKPESEEGTEA